VNGARLYYHERGSGPTVLFIHGMCGQANVWDGQLERLSASFRCIAYDRRGHTRSSLGDVRRRSVQLHADDCAQLIRALRIAPCFVVGSSGGALVAVDLLRRYPELVRAALLSEPPLFDLDPDGAWEYARELTPRLHAASERSGPRAAVDAFFSYLCPGLWRRLDDEGREPYRANHAELFGVLEMPPYGISVDELRSMETPCLIASGGESHPLLRRLAATTAGSIPAAERLILRSAGHLTYIERPDEFARAAVAFFERHLRPAVRPAFRPDRDRFAPDRSVAADQLTG
jgi:3-oxoadipate enol-lactonase